MSVCVHLCGVYKSVCTEWDTSVSQAGSQNGVGLQSPKCSRYPLYSSPTTRNPLYSSPTTCPGTGHTLTRLNPLPSLAQASPHQVTHQQRPPQAAWEHQGWRPMPHGPELPQPLCTPPALLTPRPGPLLDPAAHRSALMKPTLFPPWGSGRLQPRTKLSSLQFPGLHGRQAGSITPISQTRKLRLRNTEPCPGGSELCPHHHLISLMEPAPPISGGFVRKLLSPKKFAWSSDAKIKPVPCPLNAALLPPRPLATN